MQKKRLHEASTFCGSFIYWKYYVKNKNQFKCQFEIMICHKNHWMRSVHTWVGKYYLFAYRYRYFPCGDFYLIFLLSKSKTNSTLNQGFNLEIFEKIPFWDWFQIINDSYFHFASIEMKVCNGVRLMQLTSYHFKDSAFENFYTDIHE